MGVISIVVPVAARVNRVVLQCKQLAKLAENVPAQDFEFIFVGDRSQREAIAGLKEIARGDKRIRVVVLTRDFGKTAAYLAGAAQASGDCIGYLPGKDLDPSLIFGELIRLWESGAKITLGKWVDPGSRSRRSKGVPFSDPVLRRRVFSDRIYSQEIGSLLVDKDVHYVLSQISDPHSDIIEVLAWTGIHPVLLEYELKKDPGTGKECIFYQRNISLDYSEGVLTTGSFRVSWILGFVLATFGVLSTAGLIIANAFYQFVFPDWWMLIGVVLFIVGLQFILMGVFGEQIYRSLQAIRSRPAYVVESMVNPPVSSAAEGREKIEKMILSLWNVRRQKSAYAATHPPADDEED
jgi:glycosyltransferase involved in cell wall biosynthesis